VHFCLPFRNKARYLKVFNPKAHNMKKVSILLIALLAFCNLNAQTEMSVRVDNVSPIVKTIPESRSTRTLAKTSADILATDSTTIQDCEGQVGGSFLGDFIPSSVTSSSGYIGGTTSNEFTVGPVDDGRYHGFGNLYTVNGSLANSNPNWTGAATRGTVYLDELVFPTVGDERLYTAVKVGTANQFVVRIWAHNGARWGASTIAPCLPQSPSPGGNPVVIAERTFTIDDLNDANEPNRLFFDPPIELTTDSFWVYIRVDTTGNDDTLAPSLVDGSLFSESGASFQCGFKAHSLVGFYSRTVPAFLNIQRLGITQYRTFAPACPGSFLNSEFLLFPVFRTDTQNVPRVGRATLSQGNIRINNIFPNPSVGRVSVSYDLNAPTKVAFRILDNKLREVEIVERGMQPAGTYAYEFNTSNMDAGMYYLQTSHNGQVLTQKFAVAK
jgi:hypothetical protein